MNHLESARQDSQQLDADAQPYEGGHCTVLHCGRELDPAVIHI